MKWKDLSIVLEQLTSQLLLFFVILFFFATKFVRASSFTFQEIETTCLACCYMAMPSCALNFFYSNQRPTWYFLRGTIRVKFFVIYNNKGQRLHIWYDVVSPCTVVHLTIFVPTRGPHGFVWATFASVHRYRITSYVTPNVITG